MGLQRSGDDRGDQVQPGGEPPKLKVRRGADGKLKVGDGPAPTVETVEASERPPFAASERPPFADDPRPANERNIPPFGAA